MLKIVFGILALSVSVYGQTLSFRNYNVNEGLPSSQTYDIIQDSSKYIWIATDRGVSKFDGYAFVNYTTEDGLVDNTIFNLYEDCFGRIWFLSYSGQLSYYYHNKIYPFKHNATISRYTKNDRFICSFRVLPDSTLIIGRAGL